jgi:hypothetical protein
MGRFGRGLGHHFQLKTPARVVNHG